MPKMSWSRARDDRKLSNTRVALLSLGVLMGAAAVIAACNDSAIPTDPADAGVEPSFNLNPPPTGVGPLTLGFVEILSPETGHLTGLRGTDFSITLVPELAEPETPDVAPATAGRRGHAPMGSLVVIVDTYTTGARSCKNLARRFYFDLMDRQSSETEWLASWRLTSKLFPAGVPSTLRTALVADNNSNGLSDDAPNVIPDVDFDGSCDEVDLAALVLMPVIPPDADDPEPREQISTATWTVNPS